MAFCSNCGKKLNVGAKFCDECGASVRVESKNQTVFEGNAHKCFHCGQPLGAFETRCRFCGTELRDVRISNAVGELAEKLENALSEQQRINIIKNFPIPNTKEDIFEFMVLASSNFDSSYYVTHMYEEDISDAWLSKIEQCYDKAKLSFGAHADFATIESMYFKIKHECIEKENKIKYEEKEKEDTKARLENAKQFQKSKLKIVLIVFSVISALFCAVAFSDGKILAGIIAIAMFSLFVLAFLMGCNIVKEKIVNIKLLLTILAFVLLIPYLYAYNGNVDSTDTTDRYVEFEWPSIGLSQYLPNPPTSYGKIYTDDASRFNIEIYQVSQDEFENYVKHCKEKGFTVNITKTDSVFYSYHTERYKLDIFYLTEMETMEIFLDAPEKMSEFKWPSSKVAQKLPVPPTLVGRVWSDTSDTFGVNIADISQESFSAYIDACMDEGFTVDYVRSENYFNARNIWGDEVTLRLGVFDVMEVYISSRKNNR